MRGRDIEPPALTGNFTQQDVKQQLLRQRLLLRTRRFDSRLLRRGGRRCRGAHGLLAAGVGTGYQDRCGQDHQPGTRSDAAPENFI